MSPIALYKEIQAQNFDSEMAPMPTTSHASKRPQLMAQWVKEDGKLVCKWHLCE